MPRVKHPTLDAEYELRASQVEAWLAAGWVLVGGVPAAPVEVTPEPVDPPEQAVEPAPVDPPKRQPRKG